MSHTVKCGLCQGDIELLKDSTEGQKVYHGGCWDKVKKEKK